MGNAHRISITFWLAQKHLADKSRNPQPAQLQMLNRLATFEKQHPHIAELLASLSLAAIVVIGCGTKASDEALKCLPHEE
jgi:hypothetical protein